jgi:pyruvate dehydrogenase E2 component (dihydrolipoamide acetyltransferase)
MAKEVIMPKFGFTQESAEIVKWLKHEGDAVEMGDPIAEVTTDKVNMEVEATESGILAGLRYKEGDIVPVTQIIAFIIKPGESAPQLQMETDLSSLQLESAVNQQPLPSTATANITPVAMRVAQDLGVNPQQIVGTGIGGRITREDVEAFVHNQSSDGKIRATPAARRVAREQNIDLHSVHGTGPSGRVQGSDVVQFAAIKSSARAVPDKSASATFDEMEAEIVSMTSIRRTIAERLQHSHQEAPHIYLDVNVDVTALEALRQRANKTPQANSVKISLTALIIRIAAWALGRNPYINSRLDGNKVLLFKEINIGMAVALENGLIVPVIRNADKKSVFNVATEMTSLTERARLNQLHPNDLANGTFTISNLGMFGVDRFTAIINPPQSAILAIGRVTKRFMPDENEKPVLRPMMTVTLSADHRVVDGAVAAIFLRDLRDGLEHPEMIIL